MKTIGIPADLFQIDLNICDSVVVYALDSHTIGISQSYIREWIDVAMYYTRIRVSSQVIEGKLHWIMELPRKFELFYLLNQPDTKMVKSINGGNVLITVTRNYKLRVTSKGQK